MNIYNVNFKIKKIDLLLLPNIFKTIFIQKELQTTLTANFSLSNSFY